MSSRAETGPRDPSNQTRDFAAARSVTLWLHTNTESSSDVLFNASHLPQAKEGDVIELLKQDGGPSTSLLFHVPPADKDGPKKSQMQVSVSSGVAQAFDLQPREHVILSKIESPVPLEYHATECEIYFKDAYVGRSDLHRLVTQLTNTCAWVGQRLTLPACNLKARLADLAAGHVKRRSALITQDTKIVFRSHSAKFYIFLQISAECWNFDVDGSLFFEKAVGLFLPELFARWAARGTNHAVSLVLFSRILYEDDEVAHTAEPGDLGIDTRGRKYRDVYKVVSDFEPHKLWLSVLQRLKEEFLDYQERVLLQLKPRADCTLAGRISAAHEGNVLEAINLAITSFEKHYIDRDLQRTGLSCIIVTAGTCHFDVSKNLLRLTRERMRNYGICIDCVSLSKVPLHQVPVFRFEGSEPGPLPAINEGMADPRVAPVPDPAVHADSQAPLVDDEGPQQDAGKTMSAPSPAPYAQRRPADPLYYDGGEQAAAQLTFNYIPPDWMEASFYSRQPDRPFRVDRFMPRCMMSQVQRLGLVEYDNATISVPLLRSDDSALPVQSEQSSDQRWNRQVEREYADVVACGGKPPAIISPLATKKHSTMTLASSTSADDDDLYAKLPDVVHRVSPLPTRRSIGASGKVTPIESLGRPPHFKFNARDESPNRGRTLLRPTASRTSSPTRPLTPTVNRSSSIASTTRSVSNATTATTSNRKPFTPALISRIAAQAKTGPVVPMSQADTSAKTNASWTTFFRGSLPTMGSRSASNATITPKQAPASVANAGLPPLVESTIAPASDHQIVKTHMYSAAPATSSQSKSLTTISQPIAIRGRGVDLPPQALDQLLPASYNSSAAGLTPPDVLFPVEPMLCSEMNKNLSISAPEDRATRVYANPSNPKSLERHLTDKADGRTDDHAVHWKSLCTPAILPLTSKTTLSAHDLSQNYERASYSLPANNDSQSVLLRPSISPEQAAIRLLRELVYQRLQQNFQIIVPVSFAPKESLEKPSRLSKWIELSNFRDVLSNTEGSQGHEIYLQLSSQIHALRYNAGKQDIEVTIYVRKQPWSKDSIPYRCQIWTRFGNSFEGVSLELAYPKADLFDWTRLDRVVCGVESRLKNSLCYWRARFALVPTAIPNKESIIRSQMGILDESSNEEEIRVAGMMKVFLLLDAARWQGLSAAALQNPSLVYAITTNLPSAWARLEARESVDNQIRSTRHRRERIASSASLEDIANAMKAEDGLHFQDRRWNLRKYNDTFLGHELVDWLVENYVDVKTRDDAIQLGLYLQQQGLFRHVNTGGVTADEERKLLDAYAFYVLRPEHAKERQGRGWFGRATSARSRSNSPDPRRRLNNEDDTPNLQPEKQRILMSRSTVVDLDPNGRSDRAETAWLHYDVIFNPAMAYHLQFEWLSTSRVIEEQISAISRLTERFGLKLVETFIGQVFEIAESTPLHRPCRVPLIVPVPASPHQGALVLAIANELDYVLDLDADPYFPDDVEIRYTFRRTPVHGMQFIHSSGTCFIQFVPHADEHHFLFLPNRLFISHQEVGKVDPGRLLQDLRSLSEDASRLQNIWQRVLDELHPAPHEVDVSATQSQIGA